MNKVYITEVSETEYSLTSEPGSMYLDDFVGMLRTMADTLDNITEQGSIESISLYNNGDMCNMNLIVRISNQQ